MRPFSAFHEVSTLHMDKYCGYYSVYILQFYKGGFISVYGPDRILIVRLWTVEEPFSISVDSNGSLSVNILI